MTKQDLLDKLSLLSRCEKDHEAGILVAPYYENGYYKNITGDTEIIHALADEFLLSYINDLEVTNAFKKIHKWYA